MILTVDTVRKILLSKIYYQILLNIIIVKTNWSFIHKYFNWV